MVFEELNQLSKSDYATAQPSDRQSLPKNPHAKSKPRRLRRAEARQARIEARNLGAAANQNIHTREIEKVI